MFRYLGLVLFFIITVFGAGVSESLAAGSISITSCSAMVDLEYFSNNITSGICSINGSTIINPSNPQKNTLGDTTDFTLIPGTYNYTMNCNGGSDTATFVVTPPAGGCGGGTAPATPTISASTAASCGGNISLSYSSSGATRYHIYRSTNGTSGWTEIITTSSPTYTDSGLAIGYTYYYKVQADTGNNTTLSDFSNVTSAASSAACTTPIDGECGTANGVNYAYTATGYSPYAQCGWGSPSTTAFPAAGSSQSWTCSGTGGGISSPTCTATRSAVSAMSANISATPNPCTISIGGSSCTSSVTWTTSGRTAGTDGVWRGGVSFSANSNGSGVASPAVNPTSPVTLDVRNTSSGSNLASVTITAVCASGSTWNGSSCVATTPLVNGLCGGANGHAFASSDTAYTPTYNQCTAGSPSSTAFPAQGGSATWVCNGSGGGSNSEDCNATRAFSASANGSCNKVDVTWDVASGATNYTLYRTLDVAAKAPSWTNLGIFTGNVYTDAAVTNGLTYYYRVTANTGASTNHTYPAAIPVSCTIPPIPTISNSASGITLGQSISYNIAATDGDSNMTDLNFDYKGPSGVWNWNGGGQGSTNPSDVSNNFTPRASYGSLTYSLTPNTAGTYTVAAAAKDVDNPYQYAYRTLTVCPVTSPWDGSTCNSSSGTGERLIVCPVDPVNVLVGNTTQLQAKYWANAGTVTCSTSGSTDVTNSSTWSGDNNAIGTVSNSVGTKGLATGVALGTFEASATYSGLTARKDVNVTDGSGGPYTPPPDIDIVADPRIIRSGDTADVTVTVTAAYPLSCELFGAATGTFSHTTGTTEFDVVSSVLTSARIVRVICTDPGGQPTQKDARIEVIPTFQEI